MTQHASFGQVTLRPNANMVVSLPLAVLRPQGAETYERPVRLRRAGRIQALAQTRRLPSCHRGDNSSGGSVLRVTPCSRTGSLWGDLREAARSPRRA
jgi:hypothetical protein